VLLAGLGHVQHSKIKEREFLGFRYPASDSVD